MCAMLTFTASVHWQPVVGPTSAVAVATLVLEYAFPAE